MNSGYTTYFNLSSYAFVWINVSFKDTFIQIYKYTNLF